MNNIILICLPNKKNLFAGEANPSSYQFVSFGESKPEFDMIGEVPSPILGLPVQLEGEEEAEDEGGMMNSGFKDDFRSVIEQKVRDKKSLKNPLRSDGFDFPPSNFGQTDGFIGSEIFGQNFPRIEAEVEPLVVVDPLEGFRNPVQPPRPSQLQPSHNDDDDAGQVIVGVPLKLGANGNFVSQSFRSPIVGKEALLNAEPELSLPKTPASADKFPQFNDHFEHNPQFDNVHFEMDDARQTSKFPQNSPLPLNPSSGLVNPGLGGSHRQPELEHENAPDNLPLKPVVNVDDAINVPDFPDFFKLRPETDLEPHLTFMEELGHANFNENDHEQAKREQPLPPPGLNFR